MGQTISDSGKKIEFVCLNGVGTLSFDFDYDGFNLSGTGSSIHDCYIKSTYADYPQSRPPAMVLLVGQNQRAHHNKLWHDQVNGGYGVFGVFANSQTQPAVVTAVADHNEFINARAQAQGKGTGDWTPVSKIGNADQTGVFYVEDNTFYEDLSFWGNVVDCTLDATLVVRYNTFTSSAMAGGGFFIEAHSLDSVNRNCRSYEIYGNKFIGNGSQNWSIKIRGGTYMAWGNQTTGTTFGVLLMDNTRSDTVIIGGAYEDCDGMASSNVDENLMGQNGRHCGDQVGSGRSTNAGTIQPQAREPAYGWLNTNSGVASQPSCCDSTNAVKMGGSSMDILHNDDWWDETGSGVIIGTSNPGTCPTGRGNWRTDRGSWRTAVPTQGVIYTGQGTLGKCTSTDTWTNDVYVPYTYPHPLTAATAETISKGPARARINVR